MLLLIIDAAAAALSLSMPLPLLLATTAAAHRHCRCRCCYMLAACYNHDVMNETSLKTFKFYILNADKDHHSCSQGPILSLIDIIQSTIAVFKNKVGVVDSRKQIWLAIPDLEKKREHSELKEIQKNPTISLNSRNPKHSIES